METKIESTWVELVRGDITQLGVDAIVTGTNDQLWMGTGVAGAIKRIGGQVIEDEARAQAPIELGDAVPTTGGELKARWVVHAAVTGENSSTDATTIAKATRRSLEVAEMLGARTVALPAFTVGVGGFSLYACTTIMVAALRDYFRDHPRSGIRRVFLTCLDATTEAAFANALAGINRFVGVGR
jgi:O-acetyl-ADP-ribose deacetylase (regulator of RNase III)